MPRKYTRKSARGAYGIEAVANAMEAIRNGTSVRAASREFGVPAKTLRRHRDQKVKCPGSLGCFQPEFTAEQEICLVEHIQNMEKALFGLIPGDVTRLAYDYAEKLGIDHRFNHSNRMAGKDWLAGFLKRYDQLSICKPEATSLARAVGFNRAQVNIFYTLYRDLLAANVYGPTRVWNMDETGISNVQTPGKIVATKGAREVGRITSAERGKLVTVLCAFNAAGSYIPPMFVFPRKRMDVKLMNNAPAGAIGTCSDNGWTNCEIFVKWLEHFKSIAKPEQNGKHILVMDGHHSHKTLAALDFARENGIEMITLPPHCIHRMQPLDHSFFKALKAAYNAASDTRMVANKGQRIGFFYMAGIFTTAYKKTATVEKAVNH